MQLMGHQIEVINIHTNETKIYSSVRQAATGLRIDRNTIIKYIKNQKEFQTYKLIPVAPRF